MKILRPIAVLAALAAVLPAARAAAQDTLAAMELDSLIELPMPVQLVEVETARTTRCVPLINQVDALNQELVPIRDRTLRLARLMEAIALEDTLRVVPFAADDPIEAAVRDWFAADLVLARQFLATSDSTVQTRRTEAREAILERVRAAGLAVTEEGEAKVAATGDLPNQAQECMGVMLVRPAVVAACAGARTDLCAEAADTTPNPNSRFRFVPTAEDIWGVETLRPWSEPTRLGVSVQGTLSGASTNATVARGNVALVVGIEPIMQDRTALAAEDLARFQTSLDSLGFTFAHPRFLVVPGLAIRLIVGPALGGESYYFLHFGDLSSPAEDVIWSASAASGAPLAYMAPVRRPVLDKLIAGEPITLTAVRFPQPGSMEGEAVYTLDVPNIGQADAALAIQEYMASGQLQADFATLAPEQATAAPTPPAPGDQ